MTGFRADGWVDIAKEAKRLTRVIADMEWEDQDPRFERQELAYYKQLNDNGVIWEPMF